MEENMNEVEKKFGLDNSESSFIGSTLSKESAA